MRVSRAIGLVVIAGAFVGCNAILGIEEASPIGADARVGGSTGGNCASGVRATAGNSGGSSGSTGGGTGSGGTASGGTLGSGGAPCLDTQNDSKNCGVCGHDCKGAQCH